MFNHYQNDENLLLSHFIAKGYLPDAFKNNINHDSWQIATNVELIIRPQCNQKCEYCYITQYGNDLYPVHTRISNDQILKNIGILLDWIIEHRWFVQRFDLFAGDLFYDDLYYQILDLFYDKYNAIPKDEWDACIEKWKCLEVITPTNGSYLVDPIHQDKLRAYDKKLRSIGLVPGISWSTDGLYAAKSREEAGKQDYKIEQEYYDKILPFTQEMGYGFHPMIAPENVDVAIENFDWWVQMYQQYGINKRKGYFYPTFLEVRNDYWNENQITQFTKLIRHMWEYKYSLNDNSAKKMARHLLLGDGEENTLERLAFYDVCTIVYNDREYLDCGLSNMLRVNISDMSLPTCHRLTYPQFNGGTFKIENDKIVGIEACRGTSMWINLRLMEPKAYPKCNICKYRIGCLQGCLGAQYEASGEILKPCESVCALEQAKINTLLELYNNFGIIKVGKEEGYFRNSQFYNWMVEMSKERGY